MNLHGDQTRIVVLAGCLLATLPDCAISGEGAPVLQFVEPVEAAIYSTLDDIPVVLRAFAPNDVFLSAEVFANNARIATVLYCCPMCPCPLPPAGQETTLRIPAPFNGSVPPPQPWQGWTSVDARNYRLTARAVGENGTVIEATPVNITVIDLTLRMSLNSDGSVVFVIPQGSMVMGGYDLEASADLRTWMRLGPFSPGNVAAFYWDDPPANARQRRFYRAVYIPPNNGP
jgi:hypothetical protein